MPSSPLSALDPYASDLPFFTNQLGSVREHPEGFCVIQEWHYPHGTAESGALRQLYEKSAELLHLLHLEAVLSDHRAMPAITEADQQWLSEVWVPRTVRETPYRRVAVIDSVNILNRLATDTIVLAVSSLPLTVRYFAEVNEAEAWLREMAERR